MGLLYSPLALIRFAIYNIIKKVFDWANRLSNLRIMLIDQSEYAKCANEHSPGHRRKEIRCVGY